MRLGNLGTFGFESSYVIAPPFAVAHNLPDWLYFTVGGRLNVIIEFHKHRVRGRTLNVNGRYVFLGRRAR